MSKYLGTERASSNLPMKKIGANIDYLIAELAGDSDQARINLRARQVRERYSKVIKTVYRDTADLFLAHTNNVYIMRKDDVPTLIVYVDDSLFSAELNAQRELIKLKLLELFGEQIENFEIYVSRGSYKNNHPFIQENDGMPSKNPKRVPLDSNELQLVETTVSSIDDKRLRESIEKAMTADLERNKAEKGETN